MREGNGGWRMIPGNDPTSARISGTAEVKGKIENNVLELIFVILWLAKVIPKCFIVTWKYAKALL